MSYALGHQSSNIKENKLALAFGGLFFFMTVALVFKQTADGAPTDYVTHMYWAEHLWENIPSPLSYPMWHFFVYILNSLIGLLRPTHVRYACILVTALINTGVYWAFFTLIRTETSFHPAFLAFTLCLVMPLHIPGTGIEIYTGKFSPVTWHNPTNMIVKPFALLCFYLTNRVNHCIIRKKMVSKRIYMKLAGLAFLSVLAKPSFFQGFVPALFLYAGWQVLAKKQDPRDYIKLLMTFVPAAILVLLQFFMNFGGEGIGVGLFQSLRPGFFNPFLAFLSVMAFPISYLALNWKKNKQDPEIQLAIIFLLVSYLEFMLLYEKGGRRYEINFSWGVMIAYSIMWFVTTKKLFVQLDSGRRNSIHPAIPYTEYIPLVFWGWHLLVGIGYYIMLLVVQGYYW